MCLTRSGRSPGGAAGSGTPERPAADRCEATSPALFSADECASRPAGDIRTERTSPATSPAASGSGVELDQVFPELELGEDIVDRDTNSETVRNDSTGVVDQCFTDEPRPAERLLNTPAILASAADTQRLLRQADEVVLGDWPPCGASVCPFGRGKRCLTATLGDKPAYQRLELVCNFDLSL